MRKLFFIIPAVIIEVILISYVAINPKGDIVLYMLYYFELFLFFFLSLFLLRRIKPDQKSKFHIPIFIIVTGIIFRLTLIPAVPSTSPDVYRYIWEGKAAYNGINPYLVHPDSSIVSHLKTVDWGKVGFKHITSVYPPFSQAVFTVSYIISGDYLWGLKLIYLLFETLTLVFIYKLLLLKKVKPENVIYYAWLPLPLMEYFVNSHLDCMGISLLIMFIYYFEKGYIKASAVFFTLSFLSKFYPVFLFPLIFKKAGLKPSVKFLIIFTLITALAYLPFIGGGMLIFKQILAYIQNWEFNGSVYNLLKLFTDGYTAKKICTALLVLTIGIITVKGKDFSKSSLLILTSVLIFSSTVYPWYLGWTAALNPVAGLTSLIYLYFSSNFSNFTPLGQVWKEYWRVLLIEYIPFSIFFFYELRSVFFLPEKKNNDNEKNNS